MLRGTINRGEENTEREKDVFKMGVESFPLKQSEQQKDPVFEIMEGQTFKFSACQS